MSKQKHLQRNRHVHKTKKVHKKEKTVFKERKSFPDTTANNHQLTKQIEKLAEVVVPIPVPTIGRNPEREVSINLLKSIVELVTSFTTGMLGIVSSFFAVVLAVFGGLGLVVTLLSGLVSLITALVLLNTAFRSDPKPTPILSSPTIFETPTPT